MIELILFLIFFVSGAVDISCAVDDYKKGRYLKFGVDVILACIMLMYIVKLVYKI